MRNEKGFTLIELLAVILILGIIALIAIPTVNTVLQESRVGAWKSTANVMVKQAESYYQLRVIKDGEYINDFVRGITSSGKYAFLNVNTIEYGKDTAPVEKEKLMIAALEIKGDVPKFEDIDTFTIDTNGSATLKFKTSNAYCATVEETLPEKLTDAEYAGITNNPVGDNIKLSAGANVQCAAIKN